MTAPEHDEFGYGPAVYPVATAAATSGESLLQRADPTLYLISEFLRAVIPAYVGTAWNEAWAACRTDHPGIAVVQSFVPYDPGPVLKQSQFKFPLLAVFRESTKYSDRTIELEHGESQFAIAWILPPLTGGDMEQLLPLRHAVAEVIRENLTRGWDSSYASGTAVFDDVLEVVGVSAVDFANAPGVDDAKMLFPTAMLTLTVVEEQLRPLPGQYDPIDGSDIAIDLVPTDPTKLTLYDFVDIKQSTSGYDDGFSAGFR